MKVVLRNQQALRQAIKISRKDELCFINCYPCNGCCHAHIHMGLMGCRASLSVSSGGTCVSHAAVLLIVHTFYRRCKIPFHVFYTAADFKTVQTPPALKMLATHLVGSMCIVFYVLQVFYTTHIVGFICLMMFTFMHYQSMWAYTLPGES